MGSGAPSAALSSLMQAKQEAHKDRGNTTRERKGKGREGATSPQAYKKGVPPPIGQGTGSPSPHHKFAPKNQQKVAWVDMKKFSEKFFGGMFRG